jgi:hypothetical protein
VAAILLHLAAMLDWLFLMVSKSGNASLNLLVDPTCLALLQLLDSLLQLQSDQRADTGVASATRSVVTSSLAIQPSN